MKQNYPKAEARPFSYTCAGRELHDPYAWMESNDADTHAYVAQQNIFTSQWFETAGDVQKRAAALKAKADKPAFTGVVECHGKLYACRVAPGGASSAVILNADFEVTEVLMEETTDGDFHLYGVSPCPGDSDIVALSILKNGAARPSLLLYRISTREVFATLDGMFSYAWAPDGRCIYYADATADVERGVNYNTARAYYLDTGKEEILYEEKDNAVFILLKASSTGELFIHVLLSYVNTRVVHYAPNTSKATRMTPHDDSVFHHIGCIDGTHYFFTNDKAPRGQVVALTGSLLLQNAVPVLAEESRSLEGAMTVRDRLLAVYLNDAAMEAVLYDQKGLKVCDLPLPDKIGTLQLSAEHMPVLPDGAKHLYMGFESFICPPSVLCFDVENGKVEVAYNTRNTGIREDITVVSQPITARDGTRILAFLVHKKDQTPTGDVPTLMYGYGGYNVSLTPCYTAPFIGLDAVDWVDRGGLYVQCVLRGGGEYGAQWHEAGWRGRKKNAFYDFIDITEWLIATGWTSPEKIAINGGSNGGLLVTALSVMRPDLFKAVLASVPHTDMIRFCWDDRGPMYVAEYGDPRDEELFEYMHSYSPYHNIKAGAQYPAFYVQTGEFDNNVPPYHGKKFATKMQGAGGSPLCLLRVLARGSHGLGTGDVYFTTSAEMQLFAEHFLGINP